MPFPSSSKRPRPFVETLSGGRILLYACVILAFLSFLGMGGLSSVAGVFRSPSADEAAYKLLTKRGPLPGEENQETILSVSQNDELLQIKAGTPFVLRFTVQAYPGYKWIVKELPRGVRFNGERIIAKARVKGSPGAAEQLLSFTPEIASNVNLAMAVKFLGVPAPPQTVPDVNIKIHIT